MEKIGFCQIPEKNRNPICFRKGLFALGKAKYITCSPEFANLLKSLSFEGWVESTAFSMSFILLPVQPARY